MARVTVKVHPRPRSARASPAGSGDAWKLDLAAPPVDGKANEECVRFFAGTGRGAAVARAHGAGRDEPDQGRGGGGHGAGRTGAAMCR